VSDEVGKEPDHSSQKSSGRGAGTSVNSVCTQLSKHVPWGHTGSHLPGGKDTFPDAHKDVLNVPAVLEGRCVIPFYG